MKENEYNKVLALETKQSGYNFFTFIMSGKELNDLSYVDVRSISNPQGIQRGLSMTRCRKIGEFIQKPGSIFANNVIINFNEEIKFQMVDKNKSIGYLYIPKKKNIAWIIDGQHRLRGFDYANDKDLNIIVTAFINLPKPAQAELFRTINKEQKGINPSLSYDLIGLIKKEDDLETKAYNIIQAMYHDDDSPWKGDIKMLGTGPGLITQANFFSKLLPLLRKDFHDLSEDKVIKILKNYFSAIKKTFKDIWGSRRHILTKTLGFGAFMYLLPKILTYCNRREKNFKIETIEKLLSKIKKIDFSSQKYGRFGGEKGQRELATIIEEELGLTEDYSSIQL
jgi:DGQHR domain-containing protein